jgi:hypothetical protein
MVNNVVIKKASLVLITLLLANITLADSYLKEEKTTNFIITPSIAYRYDVFKWSIADSYFSDKKVSELVWKNRILQPGIKIQIEPKPNHFTFLGQVKYGYILKNQSKSWDHDWDNTRDIKGNVTSKLVSTSKSQATGNILDLSGAVGYSVNLFKNNLLTFYVGYDYSDYGNKNYGSRQLLYKKRSRPFSQLVQKYYFKNHSPWLGLSVNAPLNERFTIIPTIKFYSFKHIGKGYWVHRGDLKQNPSLKNNAKGIGLGFDVDFLYKYSDNLDFKINLETKRFKMKTGKDTAFFNSLSPGGERDYTENISHLSAAA